MSDKPSNSKSTNNEKDLDDLLNSKYIIYFCGCTVFVNVNYVI